MRILLVDDDEGILAMGMRYLAPLQAEVFTANGVEAAIEQMRKIPPPDVLLLDLILPPGGASETLASLEKLRSFNPNLTVIVISGMDEKKLLEAVSNFRVEGVMHKGEITSQARFFHAIRDALAKSPSAGALLNHVDSIVETLVKAEVKRKTQPIT